jgi:hypothetical protein
MIRDVTTCFNFLGCDKLQLSIPGGCCAILYQCRVGIRVKCCNQVAIRSFPTRYADFVFKSGRGEIF